MRVALISTVSAFFLTLAPQQAPAQSVPETLGAMKSCRALTDDAQRLKCYDDLAVELPAPVARPAPDNTDIEIAWNIEEGPSPLDSSPSVNGFLAGVKGESALVLRCREKKTDVIFNPGSFVYLGNAPVRVLARIDDGKVIETRWTVSTTGRGAFAPSAVDFIRALPDNGKLFLRVFSANGSASDGEFRLGKVSEVRERIADACNWRDKLR
ncbi:MAG: hypothetical protein FJX62_04275 [Alphaproteobacteria bacterium]|nr:hypothetical protein [Alphaproteobacteria bacterium]